jgi:hypothetical protein
MLLVGGWLRWTGDCSWSQLTVLLLVRLLGVLLFTGARSMRRAVQWSPMKPERELIWLVPLKSSPTCSYRWLHCDLQNVPHEHAKCTAGNVHANWSEASCWLTDPRRLVNCLKRLSVYLSSCLVVHPSVDTTRNNTWIVAIVGYHGNPVYRTVTWIPICIIVTSVAIW